jgi:hypothetical protein
VEERLDKHWRANAFVEPGHFVLQASLLESALITGDTFFEMASAKMDELLKRENW